MSPDSSSCAGCARPDRRQFLTSASLLSVGALAASACGDGVIGAPAAVPSLPATPFRVDLQSIPALQQIGGRAVITVGSDAPVLVERLGATEFRAFGLVCPHRGTIVDVRSDGFRCPNHEARFDLDGRWIGGQPTSDLERVAVRRNADGSLTVGGAVAPPTLVLSQSAVVFAAAVTSATLPAQLITIANSGGGALTGLTVQLAYGAGQPGGWLAVNLSQANTPATLTLTAQRGTLAVGSYTATVTVGAAAIPNGAQSVTVSLLVQDPSNLPALQLSSTALAFTGSAASAPSAQTVQCVNAGGGAITGLTAAIAYSGPAGDWLSASFNQTAAPAALTVRATPGTLAAGSYGATITVSAPGVGPRTITISLSVAAPGLVVTLAAWPALANVGGVAGSVGNVNGGPVAVSRVSATSFAAFSMRCPHAGTTINVVNGISFRCPNHGALFNSGGQLLPNSPQRTDNLSRLTVVYTPGATSLSVS